MPYLFTIIMFELSYQNLNISFCRPYRIVVDLFSSTVGIVETYQHNDPHQQQQV